MDLLPSLNVQMWRNNYYIYSHLLIDLVEFVGCTNMYY